MTFTVNNNVHPRPLSKAFDKVNHAALHIKLMKRCLPSKLLDLLVYWLDNCSSCVKWCGVLSQFFKLDFGVRQSSVLSPFFVCYLLDDIFDYRCNSMSRLIILYADDIMLRTRSFSELQLLLTACEQELLWLDMSINCKKSCCMRISPCFNVNCNNIITSSGFDLPWVNEIRYLGIYIV